ncbi:hypothetical protein GE107_08345 [Cohnella sp. CFH 77786]|uniref:Uma2 family endonuclease n=1 Tax=Cohnella sp. CFH 77786 TaxID=2662265 RepID=UPI001C60A35F|nr:Uma2 family endonuclease [Cohnella sp. CFH 77786]MBW5446070.1 hypothetical protein [Cohnella sp. CFH 77786]
MEDCHFAYWIVDPEARTLEQYRHANEARYELSGFYEGDDRVTPRIGTIGRRTK